MCHGGWGLDSAPKTGASRSSAVAIPNKERGCLAVLTVLHLLASDALVCSHIFTTRARAHDSYDRVPPENGHGDVSFWYAT